MKRSQNTGFATAILHLFKTSTTACSFQLLVTNVHSKYNAIALKRKDNRLTVHTNCPYKLPRKLDSSLTEECPTNKPINTSWLPQLYPNHTHIIWSHHLVTPSQVTSWLPHQKHYYRWLDQWPQADSVKLTPRVLTQISHSYTGNTLNTITISK